MVWIYFHSFVFSDFIYILYFIFSYFICFLIPKYLLIMFMFYLFILYFIYFYFSVYNKIDNSQSVHYYRIQQSSPTGVHRCFSSGRILVRFISSSFSYPQFPLLTREVLFTETQHLIKILWIYTILIIFNLSAVKVMNFWPGASLKIRGVCACVCEISSDNPQTVTQFDFLK